ncbi:LOW QUALITY PROTEIN: hypothetical protein MAR_014526 [Mya arenaria]|uniref:Uncharacterized protein n=1 Tax=Mya arenaria TaxID=6604 RepID=A0ABY7G2Y7_MYAAR|nr:LOW QUALITY PROTEIN: hypothetical protein MAR_014526 [Mya arenaria]
MSARVICFCLHFLWVSLTLTFEHHQDLVTLTFHLDFHQVTLGHYCSLLEMLGHLREIQEIEVHLGSPTYFCLPGVRLTYFCFLGVRLIYFDPQGVILIYFCGQWVRLTYFCFLGVRLIYFDPQGVILIYFCGQWVSQTYFFLQWADLLLFPSGEGDLDGLSAGERGELGGLCGPDPGEGERDLEPILPPGDMGWSDTADHMGIKSRVYLWVSPVIEWVILGDCHEVRRSLEKGVGNPLGSLHHCEVMALLKANILVGKADMRQFFPCSQIRFIGEQACDILSDYNGIHLNMDSPEGKSYDAKSATSKTSINVKIPSAHTIDEQRKKAASPGSSRRKTPTHSQNDPVRKSPSAPQLTGEFVATLEGQEFGQYRHATNTPISVVGPVPERRTPSPGKHLRQPPVSEGEIIRQAAASIVEKAWIGYRDRQMFKLLKHAVCAAVFIHSDGKGVKYLSGKLLPRHTVFYDIIDFLYNHRMTPRLRDEIPLLVTRPITQDIQIQHIRAVTEMRRSKQARMRAMKMRKMYGLDREDVLDSRGQTAVSEEPEDYFDKYGITGEYGEEGDQWEREARKLYEWTQELSFNDDLMGTPRLISGNIS